MERLMRDWLVLGAIAVIAVLCFWIAGKVE